MLYLVHVRVTHQARAAWTEYMRDQHIDEVLATGCFLAAWMTRNEARDTEEGVGFTMCYECEDEQAFARYQSEHADALKHDHAERFAGQVQAERELLPIIARFTP